MGCINTRPVIKISSKKSFKKEPANQLSPKKIEKHVNENFIFSDRKIEDTPHFNIIQAKESIKAKDENNEYILYK